ncbi:MAG: lamin tail domain-containing protein [Phycisphaerae bacterium]|nr:lamin tail domain-containing protein [Phycisphaerae bacterium]
MLASGLLLACASVSIVAQPPAPTPDKAPAKRPAPRPPTAADPSKVAPDKANPPKPERPSSALVEFPHPLITEILYAVPTGVWGDANKDDLRDANGDEFIELVNPHDEPIQLAGYRLSDRPSDSPERKGNTLSFAFPRLELKPGQVVVVFNGHGAIWSGPVGDSSRAPEGPHEKFSNAYVFTMRVATERAGLANAGDLVLLTAPDGTKVQCVTWGDTKPIPGAKVVETAPLVSGRNSGSVARRGPKSPLQTHPEVDGVRFSPGFAWIIDPRPSVAPADPPK